MFVEILKYNGPKLIKYNLLKQRKGKKKKNFLAATKRQSFHFVTDKHYGRKQSDDRNVEYADILNKA